jgi:hypothetical protein
MRCEGWWCQTKIHGTPYRVDGKAYCCQVCAAQTPCPCGYPLQTPPMPLRPADDHYKEAVRDVENLPTQLQRCPRLLR